MRSEQNNNRGGTSGGAQKRLRRIRLRSDGNATMAMDSTSGGNMASVLNGTEAVRMSACVAWSGWQCGRQSGSAAGAAIPSQPSPILAIADVCAAAAAAPTAAGTAPHA